MLFHTWKLWRNKSLFWRLFLIILAINLSMCHSISVASSQPFTQRFSKSRKYLLIQCNGRLLNLSMSIYHLIHRTSGNDETYLILVLHWQSSNLGRKLEPKKNRYFFSKLEITKTSLWNSSTRHLAPTSYQNSLIPVFIALPGWGLQFSLPG